VWNPCTNYIIDEALVEGDLLGPSRDQDIFMKTKENGSPWGSRRGTHASARSLFPKSVTETKEVVLKNQGKGFNKCFDVAVLKLSAVGVEKKSCSGR
jgi:hypothetical protein